MAQAARLLRQTTGRDDEHVCLLTDATPDLLDAQKWLHLNRAGFGGIENGLHQRLDVSHNADGRFIASGGKDQTVRLWPATLEANAFRTAQRGHSPPLFSPDGT